MYFIVRVWPCICFPRSSPSLRWRANVVKALDISIIHDAQDVIQLRRCGLGKWILVILTDTPDRGIVRPVLGVKEAVLAILVNASAEREGLVSIYSNLEVTWRDLLILRAHTAVVVVQAETHIFLGLDLFTVLVSASTLDSILVND